MNEVFMELKRCTKCNLPETYPGIKFDENGVCNLCLNFEDTDYTYLGEDKLFERVKEVLSDKKYENRPYDAAVAFSGGRDSTYLVHYVKNVLKLNVVAVSLSHDFLPEDTVNSSKAICDALGVDLKYIENEKLNVYGRKLVRAWSKDPDAGMLVTFCSGCRYGIKKIIPDFCREQGIPLLFIGNNRMEKMSWRQDLISSDPSKPSTVNTIKGYAGKMLRNPRLMGSPKCLYLQGYEFLLPRLKQKEPPVTLAPMRDYFYLPEDELINKIKELGWYHDSRFKSTWRADCYVNVLRQYYYKRILDLTDQDVHYGLLIRQGKMTREEALEELKKETGIEERFLREIMKEYYDLDFDEIEARIAKKENK
jgi:tRNA(Ile)-lysidine synthase TilS/MesJ